MALASLFSTKALSWLGMTLPMLAGAPSSNITGKLLSVSTSGNRIQFQVEIKNAGSTEASGNLRVKPYLVARDDAGAAIVLPNLNGTISIAPQGTQVLSYDAALPAVPSKDWFLGAVINPNWAIAENAPRSRYDNTPDIIPVGRISNANAAPVPTNGTDFYPRVVDNNELSYGMLSHPLRAIARQGGTLEFPDEDLRALFGVISFETRKVTLLDYNRSSDPENPEKDWYAISWNSEKEGNGNDIEVDYYSNNILFSHIAPGAYRFFTLLNSQDKVEEGNIFDNMETLDLDLSLTNIPAADAIYVATTANQAGSRSVNLKGAFAARVEYEAEISSSDSRLNVSLGTGNYSDEQALAVALPTLGAGRYEGSLKIKSRTIPEGNAPLNYEQTKTIPVKYWVFDGAAPVLQTSTTSVALKSHQGRDSSPGTVTFSNTGGAPLEFALKTSKPWLQVSPRTGTIQPGQQVTIQVVGTALANLGGDSYYSDVEGSITIQANTLEDASLNPISVSLQTDNTL